MGGRIINDYKEFLYGLNAEEARLRLKRRWLMNAPLTYLHKQKFMELDPMADKSIPESFLRKDDPYYDTIKNFVEGDSGLHALCVQKLIKNGECVTNMLDVLDGMTTKELCYLSELVTEGSVKFEKTRVRMRSIIKNLFPTYHRNHRDKIKDQLSSLPENPQYLSGICEDLCSSSESFRDSAIEVLDMLEEVPEQALEAMHRKLKGKTGLIRPTLYGDKRLLMKRLYTSPLRIHCMKMLSELDEGKPPPVALAEALSIAGVMLKLLNGRTRIIEFKRFSPKVEDLQSRIAKAIHVVAHINYDLLEVICKKLNLEVPKRYSRFAIRKRLIEYLVECSERNDVERMPKGFVEILNDINNMAYLQIPKNSVKTSKDFNKALCSSSSGSTSKNEVEEEVEFFLCFSAQIKQVMLDLLPEDEDIDQDFATAYMEEEPEDNDEEEDYTIEFDSSESNSVTESMGESKPDQSPVSTQKQEQLDSDLETDSFRSNGLSSFSHRNQSFSRKRLLSATFEDLEDDSESKTNRKDKGDHMQGQFNNLQQQCNAKNKYLSMQRACDETAMAMHRAIDGIANELAKS